jgi:hypothetical protein
MADEIAVIGEQQRETLALLRQLIELLLPKAGLDKPKLEDLMAALVGQQTRMLVLLQQIGSDVSGLLDRCASEGGGRPNGQHAGNGTARP